MGTALYNALLEVTCNSSMPLINILWFHFLGALKAWDALCDCHPHLTQPSQCCLPSEIWIHTGKWILPYRHVQTFNRHFAGGPSERGRPQVWTLAWRWILPKDALKLISTLLTEHKQSEDKIFSYVNQCFFSFFEEYRILERRFATNGRGNPLVGERLTTS